MNFKMKVGDLLKTLEKVLGTVDKKGTAGSGNVFITAVKTEKSQVVYFYSTNLVAETTDKLFCEVGEAGSMMVNPDQLRAGLAGRDPEEVAEVLLTGGTKKNEGQRIRVKLGKNQFHMGFDPAGTEQMEKKMKAIPFRQQAAYKVGGKDLAEFVRRGMFCIPNGSEATNRYEMGGMRLTTTDRGYEAHATDGHVCARILVKGEKGPASMEGVLIPQAALPSLSRLVKKEEDIEVIEGDKNGQGAISKLFFKLGDTTFFGTRLLNGPFPNVEGALKLNAPDFWFKVDREQLKIALNRAAAFDPEHVVNLSLTTKSLTIRAASKICDIDDTISVENVSLPEEFTGAITIDVDYLLNIANTSAQEYLRIGISKPGAKAKALVVDDADDKVETLYAIMPKPATTEQ